MNPYQQGQFGLPQQPCAPNVGMTNLAPQSFQNTMPISGFSTPVYSLGSAPGYPQVPQCLPQQNSNPGYPQVSQGFTQQNPNPGYTSNPLGYPQPTPSGYPQPAQGNYSQAQSGYKQNFEDKLVQVAPKSKPTVTEVKPFDASKDAAILRKAMKGLGTDEKAIISVIPRRTAKQRWEIASAFQTMYGKDLMTDLKSESSGRFRDLLVALMTPMPQFAAKELHDAMAGVGTDEGVLIEIICAMPNQDIKDIKDAYVSAYGHSLEDDIRGDTSGNFKKLMTSLAAGERSECYSVDKQMAIADARSLLKAGEKRLGTDEEVFNTILCSRSLPQLKAMFEEYHNLTRHDIDNAIKSEFSGDIQKALRALVKMARNPPLFFAERLHKSMKGFGTNDRQLIRIMVMRAEIDLGDIADRFQSKYDKSLRSWIEGDCSGHYKKCLLGLLGPSASK